MTTLPAASQAKPAAPPTLNAVDLQLSGLILNASELRACTAVAPQVTTRTSADGVSIRSVTDWHRDPDHSIDQAARAALCAIASCSTDREPDENEAVRLALTASLTLTSPAPPTQAQPAAAHRGHTTASIPYQTWAHAGQLPHGAQYWTATAGAFALVPAGLTDRHQITQVLNDARHRAEALFAVPNEGTPVPAYSRRAPLLSWSLSKTRDFLAHNHIQPDTVARLDALDDAQTQQAFDLLRTLGNQYVQHTSELAALQPSALSLLLTDTVYQIAQRLKTPEELTPPLPDAALRPSSMDTPPDGGPDDPRHRPVAIRSLHDLIMSRQNPQYAHSASQIRASQALRFLKSVTNETTLMRRVDQAVFATALANRDYASHFYLQLCLDFAREFPADSRDADPVQSASGP